MTRSTENDREGRLSRATRNARTQGSTLAITMIMIMVLVMIAGGVISSISARYQTAARSACWNEALITAEAGVDMTLSEITRLIPDVRLNTVEGLGLGLSQQPLNLLSSLSITPAGLLSGNLATITPPPLVHGGEGSTTQEVSVSLELIPLTSLLNDTGNLLNGGGLNALLGGQLVNTVTGVLNGQDLQLIRLRSTGKVSLPGLRRAGLDSRDNALWKPSLIWDRAAGKKVTQPFVSRQVEVILRPVFPFESAVASQGDILALDPGAVFDSFNSILPTASTSGEYDSSKRLQNGTVATNGSVLQLGGVILGNAKTSGGNLVKDSHVSGQVNNSSYVPMPAIKTPTWTGSILAPPAVITPVSLAAGTVLLPAQYKFTDISGTLTITKGLLGLGTNVEIYVTGDLTGSIVLPAGVSAKVYVSGNIKTTAAKLKNGSRRASNLQIYGVPTGTVTPTIEIDTTGGLIAAIYAPGHDVKLTGAGDVSGAISANRFETTGASRVHFDESLALGIGPLLHYGIASWVEVTL